MRPWTAILRADRSGGDVDRYARKIDAAATPWASIRRHRLTVAAAAVALLALVAASCSTSGESSSSSTAPTEPAGEESTGAESDEGQAPVGSDLGDGAGESDDPPTVEAVSYPSGDLQLEGDLHLPSGPGPHPAVVLIHGSGPNSRHAALPGQLGMVFGFAIPIFDELATALTAAGWAVLTYDKRSCGTFNGCATNGYPLPADDITTETFAADAQGGVDYLRTRDDVKADSIVVAGHSQGSSFVPGLLRDDPQLQAGIMLAAPYDPIDQVLTDQATFLAGLVGPAADDDPAVAQTEDLAAQVADLRDDPAATELIGGASAGFWRSWMEAGDAAPEVLAEVTQPVLLLFGGNDWNVPIDQAAKWRTATEGLDHVQLVAVECITHALNCLTESDPIKITADHIGRTVDPTVPASMIEFLADT